MNIEWNKVTWYSKLGALILLIITTSLVFYFRNEYQEIQTLKNSFSSDLPHDNNATEGIDISDWQTYHNEKFGFEVKYPEDWYVTFESPNVEIASVERSGYLNGVGTPPKGDSWITFMPSRPEAFIEGREEVAIYKDEAVIISDNEVMTEGIRQLFVRKEYWKGDLQASEHAKVLEQILSTFRFIEPIDTSEWQTYRNEEFAFEFQFPRDVTIQYYADYDDVVFRLPGMEDGPFLSLIVDVNSDELSVEDYYDGDPQLDLMGISNSEFSLISVGETTSYEFVPIVSFAGVVVVIVPFEGHFIRITDEGSSFQANGIFDQILSTFRFIEEPQCSSSSHFGCGAGTSGVPPNPNTPPVCGCIPECSPGSYVFVSAGSGFWPDGSQKGLFNCSSAPPPP